VTHHFLNEHRGLTDLATFLCAGVAVVSLSQAALVLTCISTLIAIALGGFRLHDRIRYGPGGKAE
jgi:hypothetical protein